MGHRASRRSKRTRTNLNQRENGIWYFRARRNGKSVTISTKCKDYESAKVKAVEFEVAFNRGELTKKKDRVATPIAVAIPTYQDYAQTYLDTVSVLKPSGHTDAARMRPSMAFFGATPLDRIDGSRCEEFLAHLRTMKLENGRTPKPNTQKMFFIATGTVFNRAVAKRLITVNPFKLIDKTFKPRGTHKHRILSVEDQDAIDAILRADMRRAFRAMLFAGLRIEETTLLRVEHVDEFNHMLRLTPDITKGGKARNVPMQMAVEEALCEQMNARGIRRGQPTARLFEFNDQTLWRHFATAVIEAKLAPATPHDCRRTFASRCADAGVPVHTLAKWMGHGDVKVLLEFYVRSGDEESTRAMEKVNLGAPVTKVRPFKKTEDPK